jgi:phosphate:Na+ symporter
LEIGLLLVVTGLALAVSGTTIVCAQVEGAWSMRLELAAMNSAQSRWRSLVTGFGIGLILPCVSSAARVCQSQSARLQSRPGALLASFLALEVGASVAAALMAISAPVALPSAAVVAAVLHYGSRRPRARALGRVFAGVAVVLLAVQILTLSAPWVAAVHARLPRAITEDVFLAVGVGILVTVGLRSTLCSLLVLSAVCSSSLLMAATSVALGLGVATAGALLLFRATEASPQARMLARRVLCLTLGSAVGTLFALDHLELPSSQWTILVAHGTCSLGAIGINHALQCWRTALHRLRPIAATSIAGRGRAHTHPTVLLADLTRQIARLGRVIELRLVQGFRAFLDHDNGRNTAMPDEAGANKLYLQIKRDLTALHARGLSNAEAVRWEELLAAAVTLEHVGDEAEHFLRRLEQFTQRAGAPPELEPLAEICGLHALVVYNVRIAMGLCVERRMQLAHCLLAADTEFLMAEGSYRAAHLRRFGSGGGMNLLASATHLEILGDLRRINLQICALGRMFIQLQSVGPTFRLEQDLIEECLNAQPSSSP